MEALVFGWLLVAVQQVVRGEATERGHDETSVASVAQSIRISLANVAANAVFIIG